MMITTNMEPAETTLEVSPQLLGVLLEPWQKHKLGEYTEGGDQKGGGTDGSVQMHF